MQRLYAGSCKIKLGEFVKSRHSREGGNPEANNFIKRMDSRLKTSGMTDSRYLECSPIHQVMRWEND